VLFDPLRNLPPANGNSSGEYRVALADDIHNGLAGTDIDEGNTFLLKAVDGFKGIAQREIIHIDHHRLEIAEPDEI